MKKFAKFFCIVCCMISAIALFAGCNDTDKNSETPELNEEREAVYSIDDIKRALEFDSTATVTFSSAFAKLTVATDTGLIGLFDMQGNMNQVRAATINSDDYDVIQISDIGLWNQYIRRVKITFYRYADIILNEYESIKYLEPIAYIQCSTEIVTVYAKS